MHPNGIINDPIERQRQIDASREEQDMYDQYCNARLQYGYYTDPPKYNRFGQIINLPPNLRKNYPPMAPPTRPPNQFFVPNAQSTGYHLPNSANSFALSFLLSDDPNSLALQFFKLFQHHPTLPKNLTPKRVIFVYETPDAPVQVPPQNVVHHVYHYPDQRQPQGRTADASVGDFSVVRHTVETQTEWGQTEQRQVPDNRAILHNAIMPSDTKAPTPASNLSEPGMPELNQAVYKVARWLQMTQNLSYSPNPSQQLVPVNMPQHNKNLPTHIRFKQPSPPSAFRKHQCHGSQGSGKFKKRNVPLTIVRHSTAELKMNAERPTNVVGDGDDKMKGNGGAEGDTEKPAEANNESLDELSAVAEKCSASNEVQADINTELSHGQVDESQKESTEEADIEQAESSETSQVGEPSE